MKTISDLDLYFFSFVFYFREAQGSYSFNFIGILQVQRVEYIPPAILGTIGFSTLLYCLLAISLCVMVTSSDLLMCTNDRGDIMQAQPVAAIEDPQICGYQLYHDCSKSETAPLQAWRLAYVYAFNLVGKQ